MKKFRKIILFVITIILMFSTTTYASVKIFFDTSNHWGKESIDSLIIKGVIDGYEDNTFRPDSTITRAEFVKIALSSVSENSLQIESKLHWATNIFREAENQNIVLNGEMPEDTWDKPITRYEIAMISERIAKHLLNEEEKDTTNIETIISDYESISQNPNYVEYVEQAYLKGLIKGYEDGSFNGTKTATRAEACTVINRLINSPMRIYVRNGKLKPLVNDDEIYINNPKTIDEIENIFLYMSINNLFKFTVNYTDLKEEELKDYSILIEKGFDKARGSYPEHMSYTNGFSFNAKKINNEISITYFLSSNELYNKEILKMKSIFFTEVEKKLLELIDNGYIAEDMTEYEKAKFLYGWITKNTKYDMKFGKESYYGYGQIINGLAVCQGYTSTYNTMLRLLGIEAYGISGESQGNGHIWTKANLDGKIVHIDTTFGDPVPDEKNYTNYDYFAKDSVFMKKNHTWDADIFGN